MGSGRIRPSADLHGQDAVFVLSTDPHLRGAPTGHSVAGARGAAVGWGLCVAICGEIMTMPGLPKVPSAEVIRLNDQGFVEGLF